MKQYLNKEFLLSNKTKLIKAAVIAVIIIVCFFVFVLGDSGDSDEDLTLQSQQKISEETGETTEESGGTIIVDVGGAVKVPQVVELDADSRVADAVAAAGGLLETADTAGINQAAFLTDGEKIYIPEKGENLSDLAELSGAEGLSSGDDKVNINTATSEELQTLSGVGPATAEKILDYRSSNGAFKRIEDLKKIDGIGDKTFEKLKEQIKV
ncbi:helix-hairpin-helix domain-containing protein [bacterium 210820-DFI.6.37]|nr:helix-hairpin-helix domain-containing protein [bacterium 210820-DFI.6.37]